MNRTTLPTRRTNTRRTTLALAGAAAGIALALAAPLAASAHVHVDPGTASAGASETLAFTFSHGCDGSPTTALAIGIPEEVATTTPVAQGGWTIQRELGADEQPTRVIFTSDAPVESGIQASVSLAVTFSEDAANATLAFPVTQICVDGETAWVDVAEDGADPESLEAPAPTVVVGDVVAEGDGHGHADGAADAAAAADHDEAPAPAAADPVARWLAGGALALALAALVVAVVCRRRA
ncbi:DUF1775 domain-containing protein [Microbacterium sp. SS28]|uniref:DUF1775 domain-containing protein n=1 Tax=Microbacterium sp. SS28 TaxID=2919948 RepID=UPI001FAA1547|nr:DUF1775 domain-containing protein [Microbacterium sp. SS28]